MSDKAMDWNGMTLPELTEALTGLGESAFRARQVFDWLQAKGAQSFGEMSNLPKGLRESLAQTQTLGQAEIVKREESASDGTIKYLYRLRDDNLIEGVLMRYGYGNALCVSTQVGCRMGCTFCASTLEGRVRDLSAGEMMAQVHAAQRDTGERVSSLVLMGSGEPLDNFDNTLRFVELLSDPKGLNLGQRHITLSTCGLTDRIRELAARYLQITLAVSLHAPNDELRREMMPVARAYPLPELLAACKEYGDVTHRRVTFEYALVAGKNDSRACAIELAGRLHHMLCHVNLIPVNPVEERGLLASPAAAVEAFAQTLRERGIETTIRRKLGSDVNAACGQLRRRTLAAQKEER